MEQQNEIGTVSDYIKAIEENIKGIDKNQVLVFRGEVEEFEQPCYPNLFRRKILETNPYFEKNQFDEMTANHLTKGRTYLEKAIDAQHGGFPSRLLDVTYNCLVALYFAITPFYNQPEDSTDKKGQDGIVYIFPVEKMYCPTGNNIINAYDTIVCRNEEWINQERIFQKNHKLIDHIKLNARIMAQQGAFLLFQGDEGEPIPEYLYKKIRINGENKKMLREELRRLYGIHTGSIYPENYNLVSEISRKAANVNTSEFSIQSELELVISNLKKSLDYYLGELGRSVEKDQKNRYMEFLQAAEKIIKDYKEGLLTLRENKKVKECGNLIEKVNGEFNACISDFYNDLGEFSPQEVEFSEEYLMIR